MRLVLCVFIAALLPVSALAATGGGAVSLSRAQAAAARGDQNAVAALATTTSRAGCMSGCASFEGSMRQRLPPQPLPPRRPAAVLRVKVELPLMNLDI